jgi:sugar-specific transcriptional regulator TrmB
MTGETPVEALKRLGLPTYEAAVFVALQRLGTATAATISDEADVPRSQVYGAAEDLADRGLVELVESSPKRYRPVSLETARTQLQRRQERERERAFEALESVAAAPPPEGGDQNVSTLRGRVPVTARVEDLIDRASEAVVMVAPGSDQLSAGIERALLERADAGVDVTVLTAEAVVADRFQDSAIRIILMEADAPADYTGRTLMVDEEAVLLSVVTPADEGVDEEAMWTAGTSIARILAEFVHTGMEAGMAQREGARDPPAGNAESVDRPDRPDGTDDSDGSA